jgi:putative peptidoglycan lipid II flippase
MATTGKTSGTTGGLVKATGIIGGLTLVSRFAGFARDLLAARILGAGLAADAFLVAFRLPNLFRRLFAEGAFSAAYVPMFSRELHGPGGQSAARAFSEDVLSVFVPVLLLFTAAMMAAMPAVVWLMASSYQNIPGKFELTVELTRLAFPYLLLISLVSLLTGILNSMAKFAAGAAAPILFNLVLVGGLLVGAELRGPGGDDAIVARTYAVAVTVSGLIQFIWLMWAVKRAGLTLRLKRPVFSPKVKELGKIILPATFGAGIYQISIFVDTFFATTLPEGSMAYLNFADRLNQLPLGVIGIALGTAILPTLARYIATDDAERATAVQATAIELAMLLTLPAALALAVCAGPLVTAFYVGGKFTLADAQTTANVLTCLVAGLPAYVLLKVLTPGFFARGDTRTPVKTAAAALALNIVLNFILVERYGITGLALAGATVAWFNCALLYMILRRRGHFRIPGALWLRLLRQLGCALAMAAMLWWLRDQTAGLFAGSTGQRLLGIGALVGSGLAVYFGLAWLTGAFDRDMLRQLRRRPPGVAAAPIDQG